MHSRYILLIFSITLFTASLQSCKNNRETFNNPDTSLLFLPDLSGFSKKFDTAEETGEYNKLAGQLFVINKDLRASELYVYAALMYGKANMPDSTLMMLNLAIDNGMSNPNVLSEFDIENVAKNASNWSNLKNRLDSIQNQLSKLENFDLSVDAMNAFWHYFDEANRDTVNAKEILKDFIFSGPQELRDYYVVRYKNTDLMFNQMIKRTPDYYAYLKRKFNADSIIKLKAQSLKWMSRFKEIYPQAVFPKIYVVPGILNSGGTLTEMGLFVGGDMFGKSDSVPMKGMTDWQKGALSNLESMPSTTIHELMHFQQNYQDTENKNNVIGKVIDEGVCDFLVELCSGEEMKNNNLDYLKNNQNLKMVLEDFKIDLLTADLSKWMYNGESISNRPHDLGYTLGYLISKSYYENHKDKHQAIYELFNTDDFTSILKGSNYAFVLE